MLNKEVCQICLNKASSLSRINSVRVPARARVRARRRQRVRRQQRVREIMNTWDGRSCPVLLWNKIMGGYLSEDSSQLEKIPIFCKYVAEHIVSQDVE